VKLSTTTGANISPTPESSQPVSSTGQTLEATTDSVVVVEPGVYTITASEGYVLAGWDTTDTAANILFVCPARRSITVHIPIGTNHIHYKCV